MSTSKGCPSNLGSAMENAIECLTLNSGSITNTVRVCRHLPSQSSRDSVGGQDEHINAYDGQYMRFLRRRHYSGGCYHHAAHSSLGSIELEGSQTRIRSEAAIRRLLCLSAPLITLFSITPPVFPLAALAFSTAPHLFVRVFPAAID